MNRGRAIAVAASAPFFFSGSKAGAAEGLASEQRAGLTELVADASDAPQTVGFSVAVSRDWSVVYQTGRGKRSLSPDEPATAGTWYGIGSVTKQFTAALIMQFVEAGALGVDDRLDTILPSFPHANELTMRQLLTHTTGLAEYGEYVASAGLLQTADVRPEQLVALIAGKPLEFAPGTRFEYSNTNYLALGMVLEQLAGKPYGEIVQERIIRPLRIDVAVSPPSSGEVARGYREGTPPTAVTDPNVSWAYAAGQLFATVGGLVAWDAALFGGRVVRPQSLALMTTPVTLPDGTPTNYGFGLSSIMLHGRRMISHDGGVPGFAAQNFVFPDDGIAIATLANTINFNLALPATKIAEVFYSGLGDALQDLEQRQAAKLDDVHLRSRAREWLDRIANASFDTSQLTPEMKAALTPEAVKKPREMLAAAGPIKKISLAGFEMLRGYRVYVYRVTGARAQLTFTFVLDEKGLIAGLFLRP